MKKFSVEYKDLVHESLEDKVLDKLEQKYLSLKKGVLELIDKSLNESEELVEVQNFINDFINKPDSGTLTEFIEDMEIFDFYLKYQVDIDELCNDKGYFNESPKTKNIFSLYDFVISGTKFSALEIMKILEKEIF